MKSLETSGSSLHSITPSGSWRAAFCRVALSASRLVGCSLVKVRSSSDTLAVGTRTARPSRRPASSGMTRPMVFAAPVLVGIIDSAAARAR
ncbi:hypothetical protein D3C84_1018770 [compost metagenome]